MGAGYCAISQGEEMSRCATISRVVPSQRRHVHGNGRRRSERKRAGEVGERGGRERVQLTGGANQHTAATIVCAIECRGIGGKQVGERGGRSEFRQPRVGLHRRSRVEHVQADLQRDLLAGSNLLRERGARRCVRSPARNQAPLLRHATGRVPPVRRRQAPRRKNERLPGSTVKRTEPPRAATASSSGIGGVAERASSRSSPQRAPPSRSASWSGDRDRRARPA